MPKTAEKLAALMPPKLCRMLMLIQWAVIAAMGLYIWNGINADKAEAEQKYRELQIILSNERAAAHYPQPNH